MSTLNRCVACLVPVFILTALPVVAEEAAPTTLVREDFEPTRPKLASPFRTHRSLARPALVQPVGHPGQFEITRDRAVDGEWSLRFRQANAFTPQDGAENDRHRLSWQLDEPLADSITSMRIAFDVFVERVGGADGAMTLTLLDVAPPYEPFVQLRFDDDALTSVCAEHQERFAAERMTSDQSSLPAGWHHVELEVESPASGAVSMTVTVDGEAFPSVPIYAAGGRITRLDWAHDGTSPATVYLDNLVIEATTRAEEDSGLAAAPVAE